VTADIYEIGWWIESAEEDLYGPVSRQTLQQYLKDGVISPDTLVRHSTWSESKPVAEQIVIDTEQQASKGKRVTGDRLAEVWPRWGSQRRQLAEGELPCARHNRPAVLVCVRCQAPYCGKCQMKPYKKPFYWCKQCQKGNYNRRTLAYILDTFILYLIFVLPLGFVIGLLRLLEALAYVVGFLGGILFAFRDVVFGGAGPSKRVFGLRVVQQEDGETPLTTGQALLRWVSLAIPFFNLVDLSVPFRDPLQRRYGDRWAGTRVLDTPGWLRSVREKTQDHLATKGVDLGQVKTMSMKRFAQLAE
jgi:uncharacterized RDD family membrane protein YckC